MRRQLYGFGAVILAGSLMLSVACADDDDDEPAVATTPTPATQATPPAAGTPALTPEPDDEDDEEIVEVTAVDYAFEGLPNTIDAGTQIRLVNDSDVELHEFVALRLPDDEDRDVEELIRLPETELQQIFTTPPTMVLMARPGEEGIAVVGDGTFTEPGRYAIVCFIPVGADPDAIMDAIEGEEQEGPPDVEGGPPHAFEGMYAEVTVE